MSDEIKLKKADDTFYTKYYKILLKTKIDKREVPIKDLIEDITKNRNITDAVELMALENKTEHDKLSKVTEDLTKRILELETKDLINTLLNKAISDLNLTKDQAGALEECTSIEIPKQIRAHPSRESEQSIAVAFSICRERLGL